MSYFIPVHRYEFSGVPTLTSVEDGLLFNETNEGDAVLVDGIVERGPWIWHSSGNEQFAL